MDYGTYVYAISIYPFQYIFPCSNNCKSIYKMNTVYVYASINLYSYIHIVRACT